MWNVSFYKILYPHFNLQAIQYSLLLFKEIIFEVALNESKLLNKPND